MKKWFARGRACPEVGGVLRYLHIDADTFRKVIDTLTESELIVSHPLAKGGFRYSLVNM